MTKFLDYSGLMRLLEMLWQRIRHEHHITYERALEILNHNSQEE